MSSLKDKVTGTVNDAVGNVKKTAGEATGDDELKREGETQEVKGKAQKLLGEAKDFISDAAHKVGDAVKKSGD